ncbi:gypsy retrotransposon integrase-like protein 1-like protein [Lasius niger]|uniref:Gypsy retrotransposon integrase-like protein 1-like protein n=1 Tax=Lasius niger TaxID=67767 RepID=A0A0J7K4A9_LASNI|nr:gypsy retrotransposon integrase-like protein 1-like protein [Lasius niger]
MFREISRYVRSCPNCLAHKVSQQRPAGTLHATPVAAPWQQAALDLIGPLPRSTQGYSWLLTIQDRFSKWMELVPLRRATAENLVRAVTQRLVYRHGCPHQLISDNGTQLTSRRFKDLLAGFGISHRTTPVYASQCNPVERANRTIKTMISQYVGKRHRNWDKRIDALQFAINTARHEATGYTPAYILIQKIQKKICV